MHFSRWLPFLGLLILASVIVVRESGLLRNWQSQQATVNPPQTKIVDKTDHASSPLPENSANPNSDSAGANADSAIPMSCPPGTPREPCFASARDAEDRGLPQARKLYQELCRDGHGDSCYRLGLLMRDLGDATKMREAYENACKVGQSTACFNLEVAKNAMEKAKVFALAGEEKCKTGTAPEICESMGIIFREVGDIPHAIPNYVEACNRGRAESCFALGEIARANESMKEADLRFRKGCDLRYAQACEALAQLAGAR